MRNQSTGTSTPALPSPPPTQDGFVDIALFDRGEREQLENRRGGFRGGVFSEKWFGQDMGHTCLTTKISPHIEFGSNLLPNSMWGEILVVNNLWPKS